MKAYTTDTGGLILAPEDAKLTGKPITAAEAEAIINADPFLTASLQPLLAAVAQAERKKGRG